MVRIVKRRAEVLLIPMSSPKVVQQVNPAFVSCVIQVTMQGQWISASPYTHIFDKLEQVHHPITQPALTMSMKQIGYHKTKTLEHPLPNGKNLVQIDFKKS